MMTEPKLESGLLPADARRLDRLEADLRDTRARLDKAQRRMAATWAMAGLVSVAAVAGGNHPAIAQTFNATLAALTTRVVALETKTAAMSAITDPNTNQPTVRFTSVNVQVVNGTGATSGSGVANGVGNVIIGYNELRNNPQNPDVRTGSHNLVGGRANNYSSNGGTVLGLENTMSGSLSCVTGGYGNSTTGLASTVSGGQGNTATGSFASASGGLGNTSSGIYASVSGGQGSTASSTASSVSGGLNNVASGSQSSVTGGQLNTASGNSSTVNGGLYVRPATVGWSWAAGGSYGASGGPGVFHSP